LNPYGEFVSTGGAYGSEVDPFTPAALLGQLSALMPDQEVVLFGTGAISIGAGVLIITTEGAGALLLLTGALALSSGIATVAITPVVAAAGDEKDIETVSTVMAFASGPGSMAGGTIWLLYYGDEKRFAKGVVIGGLTEAALTLGYAGGKAIYGLSSYGRAEAALNLIEAEEKLLLRSDLVLRSEFRVKMPWEPTPQNLPQNFVWGSDAAVIAGLQNVLPLQGKNITPARNVLNALRQRQVNLQFLTPNQWRARNLPLNISGAHNPHNGEIFLRLNYFGEVGLNTVVHETTHLLTPLPAGNIRTFANQFRREYSAHFVESAFLEAIGGRPLLKPPALRRYILFEYGSQFRLRIGQPWQ
jgi:hypothetical protein